MVLAVMEATDLINVLAILLSPVIAVLVTIWMQDRREKRGRMYWVFATVVANRHQKLDATVVQALNSIDVVFTDHPKVRQLWKEYMDITEQDVTQPNMLKRLDDKYVELTDAMARVLGYGGKVSQLEMGKAYLPTGLGNQVVQSQELLTQALAVFKGEQPLVVAAYQPDQPEQHKGPNAAPKEEPDSE